MDRLNKLHNALVGIRQDMRHPNMNGDAQWYRCAKMAVEVADDETLKLLRRAAKCLKTQDRILGKKSNE